MNRKRAENTSRRQNRKSPRTTKTAGQRSAVYSAWAEFAARHESNPLLRDNTIYALPPGLTRAIQRESGSEFFSREEEEFELDLARFGGAGFFHGCPFTYPPISDRSDPLAQSPQDARRAESSREIEAMLVDEFVRDGRTREEARRILAEDAARKERLQSRRWGYAGWLVTCPKFSQECDELREQCAAAVKRWGAIPTMPLSFTGREILFATRRGNRDANRRACTQFYLRWALDQLVTWDLPIPMPADIFGPSPYPLAEVQRAGLLVFVPWYLLRDRSIDVYEIVQRRQYYADAPHLRPWLDGKPKNWGYDRYALMLRLYIYYELALKRRYGARLQRKFEMLDGAIGQFESKFDQPHKEPLALAETIRKVRQQLGRRLKSC